MLYKENWITDTKGISVAHQNAPYKKWIVKRLLIVNTLFRPQSYVISSFVTHNTFFYFLHDLSLNLFLPVVLSS